MRNWIALLAITISFAIAAQHGNGKNKGGPGGKKGSPGVKMHPGGNKGPKMHPGGNKGFQAPSHKGGKIKPSKHNGYKMPKQKGHNDKGYYGKGNKGKGHYDKGHGKAMYKSKYHYDKGHVNHIYVYAYAPFIYPTRNYGQWRSQQAKKKHKSYPVVLELNVLNGVLMIHERNTFVLLEIDRKIERYHSLVIARHRAGLITDVQFSLHLGNVKKMKKKRGHYHY